ncbi:ABC transporter substrate-binding protein [Inquilinus sp. CAU 1745]|uniref:ABC transporter substrate-binding protein n=1 Tax=Inquilinus sp. CAU 1745 TaxID=3140369 RepID=UPI00325B8649
MATAILLLVLAAVPARADWPETMTDLAGREVTIAREPERILLGEGFLLLSLGFVTSDPVASLAGWGGDLKSFDPATYALFAEAFPALEALPTVGLGSFETFSVEQALALRPDLVVFSLWQAADDPAELAAPFEAAGIPVLFVDFYQDPLDNTIRSLELLGRALGQEERVAVFTSFYEEHLARIIDRLGEEPAKRPSVLLHAFPGLWPCCWSAGGGGIGETIELVGGRNIGADRFPTANGGQLNLEYVITQDPEIYIATGVAGAAADGLQVGSGVEADAARASLEAVVEAPGLATLTATSEGRVHGLWNFFNGSPLNILAIEAMAGWIRPDLFGDIDPHATLAEINERFSAAPFRGTYWISLDPPGPR